MTGPTPIPLRTGPADPGEARDELNQVIEETNANYPSVVAITGTAHVMGAVDVGNFLEFTNSAASTLTISAGIIGGGTRTVILDHVTSGGVTIDPGSGVTLLGGSATTSSGAVAELFGAGGNVVFMGGKTA